MPAHAVRLLHHARDRRPLPRLDAHLLQLCPGAPTAATAATALAATATVTAAFATTALATTALATATLATAALPPRQTER